jgi:hypothetical protein
MPGVKAKTQKGTCRLVLCWNLLATASFGEGVLAWETSTKLGKQSPRKSPWATHTGGGRNHSRCLSWMWVKASCWQCHWTSSRLRGYQVWFLESLRFGRTDWTVLLEGGTHRCRSGSRAHSWGLGLVHDCSFCRGLEPLAVCVSQRQCVSRVGCPAPPKIYRTRVQSWGLPLAQGFGQTHKEQLRILVLHPGHCSVL